MTVCIGAISYWAPNGQAILVASDRMITMGGFIQYEHDVSKIKFVTPRICVLIAGDTLGATRLTQQLFSKFGPTSLATVEEVAFEAKSIYEELRLDAINSEIFRPRGFTLEQFYLGGLQANLQPHLVGGIDNEVMAYDYGVELIVAGTDKTGAHLFTVGNPGVVNNYQDVGYVAIGSGGIHATQSLIGFKHSGYHNFFETIFTVFASKRRAKAAPGVGPLTDFVIIPPYDASGWVHLNNEQFEKLDSLYNQFSQPLGHEITKLVADLELFGKQEDEKQSQSEERDKNSFESDEETVSTQEDIP